MYTKDVRDTADMNLYPYLDQDCKLVSQIPEEERRRWLHQRHQHFSSHRPRHKLAPEIYDWERIFKIENQMRPRDARKRFFETFQDPINDRILAEHRAVYIKKTLRVSRKVKYENSFYPDVVPEYPEIV